MVTDLRSLKLKRYRCHIPGPRVSPAGPSLRGTMVSIIPDSTLFIQMGIFLLLIFTLNVVLYKPIRGILRQRAEKKAELSSEITGSNEGVRAKTAEMEAMLAQARSQGREAREEFIGQGREEERSIIEAATREMEATVTSVREEIKKEIGQARDDLTAQVEAFGRDLASKILGRSIG